jgi:XTP/dITP diphosphohydrolase
MLSSFTIVQKKTSYPEIQTDTLEEVVEYGMKTLRDKFEGKIIIEDSGLFIKTLNGFPGVYSAFAYQTIGNEGILNLMHDRKEREGRFESMIAYGDKTGETTVFRGICNGVIADKKRGKGGFGFDPIFIPRGSKKTFAEMAVGEKNRVSHRGKAAAKLLKFLKSS